MRGSLRGVPVSIEPVWREPKFAPAVKPYRFEISPLDQQLLTGLTLAAAPSGEGELAISALGYGAGIVTFTATGGQPTRCYTLSLSATRSDEVVSEYLLKLRVGNMLVTDHAQVAPLGGFGAAPAWSLS
jgi:hypothetical protein